MSMAMAEVQIKANHKVKPAEKTWTGTIALTESDMCLRHVFMPLLYLYRRNKQSDAAASVETLKASLSKALVHFYPFAGRLRPTNDGSRVALECDGEASWVLLVEAEETSGVELAELGVDLPEVSWAEDGKRFRNLIPVVDQSKPPHELPLFMVQITQFRCGGISLGFIRSHAVVDGNGMGHFLSEWTRLARGETLKIVPTYDRTPMGAIEPPSPILASLNMYDSAPPPQLSETATSVDESEDGATSIKEVAPLNLVVSKSHMDDLKRAVGDPRNGRPYSRFEVLAAHAWRCLRKTRKREGSTIDVLGIAADVRKRMDPPLPFGYLGNAFIVLAAISESSDLYSSPLGRACEILRHSIDGATSKYINTYIDRVRSLYDGGAWQGQIMTPEGRAVKPDLMLSSWLNLSFYNLDYGWGREAHMVSMVPPVGGFGYLMPGREEGSTIVSICMEVDQADMFKKYFYHDLV